jgi:hypothetical protein
MSPCVQDERLRLAAILLQYRSFLSVAPAQLECSGFSVPGRGREFATVETPRLRMPQRTL